MPEYLAPGVYVEEVDTGSKSIEGVSTSTAGMVGVTERGPVDVPVLITSMGEYARWYGGQLRSSDYSGHCFFPHAIEGFFTNGGKRVYVTRILDAAATKALSPLFDRGTLGQGSTILVRPANEGTGSGASGPPLAVISSSAVAAGDWIRVGDGSTAEYRVVDVTGADSTVVAASLPLSRSHADTETAEHRTRVVFAETYTLVGDEEAGSETVVLQGTHAEIAALVEGDCLEFGVPAVAEYRFISEPPIVTVVSGTDSTAMVSLDAPLALPHANTSAAVRVNLAGGVLVESAAIESAVAGAGLIYVDDTNGDFNVQADLVRIGTGDGQEVRRIGELHSFDVSPGAYEDYSTGLLVEAMQFTAGRAISAVTSSTIFVLGAGQGEGLVAGQQVVIDANPTPVTVTIVSVNVDTITVTPAAPTALATDAVTPRAKATLAAANAGASVLSLDDRMGIPEGGLLRVGTGATAEIVTVVAVPTLSFISPDPGNVVIYPGLSGAFAAGTQVELIRGISTIAARPATAIALPAETGAAELYVTDGNAFVAGETIRVTTASGDAVYHVLTQNATAIAPDSVTLTTALARSHPLGSAVVERAPLFEVEALDAGQWGNRLRISVEDESPGLVSQTTLSTVINPTTVRLASAAGVQPGTVLEFFDPASGAQIGDPVKVTNVNRGAGFALSIAGAGLSAPQQVPGLIVRSREFRITVRLLRQPDPSTPSRNEQVLDSEVFRYLSMDPRHSNYIEKFIGDIDGPLRHWDRRPEGASLYIRVRDLAANQAEEESIRLGPETLTDVLPNGRRVAAKMRLEQTVGDDSTATLTDNHYVGADNADPDLRTGLQGLRNVEEVSIVAIPGRVGTVVQSGLIDHCELMRYRFAVLDSRPEPADTISDVQDQRQQFDTKYAAMYYPWLSITDPYPTNIANVQEYAIPPSGHVIGVYARTDIDRGVHKAPANEVVRGIVGLRRKINKEQQDILNPYPVNINVIRDFRDNNRGIRIYGGRVITSDSDWKYVNVRRLMIFIEHSLNRGLEWVVFEPNAEPLWARVRRAISNFLTVVWRNGALEGTKVEEAFFVKCDRTTMTQTDIDSGRLIVLVGVAPVKPAEFVIVRIGLWTARSDS